MKKAISLREKLCKRANVFTHNAYKVVKLLPKEELFGVGSQLKRASVSVSCNIIEGFARDGWSRSKKDLLRFLEIGYGSLEESKYLIRFSHEEYHLDKNKVKKALEAGDKIGKLLFSFIKQLRENNKY
ncbi:four helix bundle protein [Patescibacteria group bacterium]